jgi:acetyl-CoA synthetase
MSRPDRIPPPLPGPVEPNLLDYAEARRSFSWAAARSTLAGLPGGRGLNIAHEAVDRQVLDGHGAEVALRWHGRNGERRSLTYLDLAERSNRWANALQALGIRPGDRVVTLLGRVPELHVTALGTWKFGGIYCPLFAAFGPEPVRTRLEKSGARVLVTTAALFSRKVLPGLASLSALEHIFLVDEAGSLSGVEPFGPAIEAASAEFTIPPTDPETPALLHFTSGTTGTPKGAVHVHGAVLAHHLTGQLALDLHPGDIYWCTADPGWVTGTSYGIIAPFTNRVTSVVDEADFDARRWYELLAAERVAVWYTAPTAIRMLMKAGADLTRSHDLSALRLLASVGEPLNPEAVIWSQETFGRPFHDNWWQTETGGIMIANFAASEVRPGSMGRPLPGIDAAIVSRTADGSAKELPDDMVGELALRPGWPSMFRAYWNEPERYAKCFAGGFYLTGDLARRDADGWYWFVGRADDVIKSMGHLIGPFEVESVLLEHPAVAEAGVIGRPDPVAGEIVKAFVSLKAGWQAGETLRRDLLAFARTRLGAVVAPKEISFLPSVPKTRSGKIMRRLLKARDLGLPEGDTSTLEEMGHDAA